MQTRQALPTLGLALAAIFQIAPAHADWVTLPNSGAPVVACNPKTGTPPNQTQSPTLTTCKVTGLPPAIMPGYILKASVNASNITINGVVVGQRYDRVYCRVLTGTTCNFTLPVVIATRLKMSPTPNFPARNTQCPVWAAAPNNECFEVNKVFRLIRGSNPVFNAASTITTPAVEVSTDIAYFMGSVAGGTNADTALATKYLEYAGKTSTNTLFGNDPGDIVPPGNANYVNRPSSPGNRDATRVMFQSDTNVFDPDGGSSAWSPWLMQRQLCPGGFSLTTGATFTTRLHEAGEEGQLPQSISSTGYRCAP